jgi:DNA-directed RNA polymerase specialized sigma24 family protein
LAEQDVERAAGFLGELVTSHAEPLMVRIVGSRLRRHGPAHQRQVEDVVSDAVVSFLLHAEEMRQQRAAPLTNLDAFVATLAARACNDYFRRAHPAFHALRNKLRYLLEKYSDLARWKDPGSGAWVCGLAEWSPDGEQPGRAIAGPDRLDVLDVPRDAQHPADQLALIFRQVDAPIQFNDLAILMARLWDVRDAIADEEETQELPDGRAPVDVTLSQKQKLGILWSRICELSRRQRVALLLNLKGADGSCGASFLVTTGVVSVRQIAQAVEFPAEEFAEIWKRLPLEDLEVASLLGLTRQQVINLRKVARAKLAREMNGLERKKVGISGKS